MDEPIRVLHVDDDADFANMVATFLEREDDRLTVDTATTVDEALSRIAETDVDCIVTDYDMPSRDGIEFLQEVRETDRILPFILFTGKGSEEVASEAISAGVSEYLQKQSGTDQYAVLANRITNLVSRSRAVAKVEQYDRRREESERYRQRLLDVVSDPDLSEETKIERLLSLGCERFGVENGHLVTIDETADRHEVVIATGTDVVREGVGSLSETYCRKTIESDDVLDLYNATEQGWADDPAYDAYGLECYIGSKLTIDDGLYGTVCFVDTAPREPFSHDEKAFFDLIVRWLERILGRQRRMKKADAIFEHAQDAIFLIEVVGDEDGHFEIQTVNRAYEEQTGLAERDVRGRTPRDLFGEEEGSTVEARYRQCVRRREPIDYDERLTIGGETRYWHTRLAPIVEDDRVVRLVGATRDVTDRRERRRRLAEEREFVESVFRCLPDPVYAFDVDGYPIRWNERLEAVTGYDADEIEDMHVTDFVPEDEVDEIAEHFRRIVEDRESVTVQSAFETKDGDRIPFEFTGGVLEDADGQVRGVTGVCRNVADRGEDGE